MFATEKKIKIPIDISRPITGDGKFYSFSRISITVYAIINYSEENNAEKQLGNYTVSLSFDVNEITPTMTEVSEYIKAILRGGKIKCGKEEWDFTPSSPKLATLYTGEVANAKGISISGSHTFSVSQRGQNQLFEFSFGIDCETYVRDGEMALGENKQLIFDFSDTKESVITLKIPLSIKLPNPVLVQPNRTTIDAVKPCTFRFKLPNSSIKAVGFDCYNSKFGYKYTVYSQPFKKLDNSFYDGEFVTFSIDNIFEASGNSGDRFARVVNGGKYFWEIKMSTYESDFEINPNYISIGYPFYTNSTPIIDITVNGSTIVDNNAIINTKNLDIRMKYNQLEDIPIKCYSLYLKDENYKVIEAKERIFSSNIFLKYNNLINNKIYYLDYTVLSQKDQIVEGTISIQVKYSSMSSFPNFHFSLTNKEETNCVELLIPQDSTGGLKYLQSNGATAIEISRISGTSSYSVPITSYNLKDIVDDFGTYHVCDYSASNNQEYTYVIYPITQSQIAEPAKCSIVTNWEGYSIYPLIYKDNKYYFSREKDSSVECWKFLLNAKESEISLKQDKYIYTTFAEKPKIMMGNLNYNEGSFSCLLGNVIHTKENGENYYEPKEKLEEWDNFIKKNSICLFKNQKGDSMIIVIENFSREYMNEVINVYSNYFREQNQITAYPTVIKFNYTEIDDINKLSYEYLN